MSIPKKSRNTSVKVTKKFSKFKDLEIEIEYWIWGMKTTVPVMIGALGLIKKGMAKYIQKIPGNIQIKDPQKIKINYQHNNFALRYSGGSSIICTVC